jgi:hypothetical protein
MTKARNMADLLDSNGDVKSGALDNVPPSNDASALTTGTLPVDRVPYLGRRNLIINGAMQVAQRGTSVSVSNNTNEGYSTIDRWLANFASNQGGAVTFEQAEAPSGTDFRNALKVSCTSTATIDVNHMFELSHRIEGQNLQHLKYGTASAEEVTLSFWVYTNKTGDYGVSLQSYDDSVATDINGQIFTVDTANTWQKFELNVSANTAANIQNNNSYGFVLNFYLSAGTARTALASSNVWQDYVVARLPSSIVNFFDSTSNVFYITGVQLEVGSVATPFEHRSYGEELALCQRYYYKHTGGTTYTRYGVGENVYAYQTQVIVSLPTDMRAKPTLHTTGTVGDYALYHKQGIYNLTSISLDNHSSKHTAFINGVIGTSSLVQGGISQLMSNNNTSAFLAFDAEL